MGAAGPSQPPDTTERIRLRVSTPMESGSGVSEGFRASPSPMLPALPAVALRNPAFARCFHSAQACTSRRASSCAALAAAYYVLGVFNRSAGRPWCTKRLWRWHYTPEAVRSYSVILYLCCGGRWAGVDARHRNDRNSGRKGSVCG